MGDLLRRSARPLIRATLLGMLICVAATPYVESRAQAPKNGTQQQGRKADAPAKLPRADSRREHSLDFLFQALRVAPDADSAKAVEARIRAIWSTSPSDTVSLLMSRVKTAMDRKEPDIALKLLDAVVKLRPDYVEGWNRRATLYYLRNDYGKSLADIREVLVREPRHFGALAGLGMIMHELGDDKLALAAYRRALEVDPHLERVPELVKQLSEKVEGRDI
jgi:tetratricopeptide (TPR) repeat protein